jgi:hypothetical protein
MARDTLMQIVGGRQMKSGGQIHAQIPFRFADVRHG